MTDDSNVHNSSGNIFADLGIEDSEEYMAKSELAAEILPLSSAGSLRKLQRPSC